MLGLQCCDDGKYRNLVPGIVKGIGAHVISTTSRNRKYCATFFHIFPTTIRLHGLQLQPESSSCGSISTVIRTSLNNSLVLQPHANKRDQLSSTHRSHSPPDNILSSHNFTECKGHGCAHAICSFVLYLPGKLYSPPARHLLRQTLLRRGEVQPFTNLVLGLYLRYEQSTAIPTVFSSSL